jgi:hypothetical protein
MLVTNWNDVLFSLVPQRDRRQVPDRRSFPRGSRRAVDRASAESMSFSDESMLWTESAGELLRAGGKSGLR